MQDKLFERFTDRARKILALANQEAQRFCHEYIGTEHILIGLVKEGSGVGATALKNLGADLKRIRAEVEKLVRSGPDTVCMGKLPYTPRGKKVFENAIEAARNFQHNYVGTEHILLGLLSDPEAIAFQVLECMDIRHDAVWDEVSKLLLEPEDYANLRLKQLSEDCEQKRLEYEEAQKRLHTHLSTLKFSAEEIMRAIPSEDTHDLVRKLLKERLNKDVHTNKTP